MAQVKILIVEDDNNIAELIKYNLEKAGFNCGIARDGEEALEILKDEVFDLIILDIMLPKLDGFELCKHIKKDDRLASIPILMLTARTEEIDRVLGFELGADDYVVKPFSTRELVLRVKAILRRGKAREDKKDILTVDKLTVDIPRRKVMVEGKEIQLTRKEFELLVALMRNRGRVKTRDALLDEVWGITADVITRTVDTHIKRLRQKLGRMGNMIETVRGLGYKFKE